MSRKGKKMGLGEFLGDDASTFIPQEGLPSGPRTRVYDDENHRRGGGGNGNGPRSGRRGYEREPNDSENVDSWRGAGRDTRRDHPSSSSRNDDRRPPSRRFESESDKVDDWRRGGGNDSFHSRYDNRPSSRNADRDLVAEERPAHMRLNLKKRTDDVSTASDSTGSSRSNPFGGARPVNTDDKTWKGGEEPSSARDRSIDNSNEKEQSDDKWSKIFPGSSSASSSGRRFGNDRRDNYGSSRRGGYGDRSDRRYQDRGDRRYDDRDGDRRYNDRGDRRYDDRDGDRRYNDRADRRYDERDNGRRYDDRDSRRYDDERENRYQNEISERETFERQSDNDRRENEVVVDDLAEDVSSKLSVETSKSPKKEVKSPTKETPKQKKETNEKAAKRAAEEAKRAAEKLAKEEAKRAAEEEEKRAAAEAEELQKEIEKLVKSGKKGDELVKMGKTVIGKKPLPSVVFTLLMKSLGSKVIEKSADWLSPNEYGNFLKYAVDNQRDVKKQLKVIFAIQGYFKEIKFPKGIYLQVFKALYGFDIIDEEVFLEYKYDVDDNTPGKMEAIIQTTEWLTWLESVEADDEEEDEEDYEELSNF